VPGGRRTIAQALARSAHRERPALSFERCRWREARHKRSEVYYANFRVNRDLRELCNLVECANLIVRRCRSGTKAAAGTTAGEYPDTLPVSFLTVLVREVRSRNKAVQSLGLRRRKPDSEPHKLVFRRRWLNGHASCPKNWTRASRTTADDCGLGSFASFRFVVSLMMSSYSSGGSVAGCYRSHGLARGTSDGV
jgi:hypothetical protein